MSGVTKLRMLAGNNNNNKTL